MAPNTTIAIDVMGGDYAPTEIIKGALQGAEIYRCHVLLVGPPPLIKAEIAKLGHVNHNAYTIVEANDVINMGDSPATAIRRKKTASIVVTAQQVKQGKAQAMVAAGSTGAAMAAALLYVGRLPGVDRPAIGVVLPSTGSPALLLDAGANADCIPEMLLQFGQMGHVFMSQVYGVAKPRIGLLNIGEELGKGNALVNTTYELLEKEQQLNFIGNVEGHDLFKGTADVVVCDGFAGNVALKSAEGVAKMLLLAIKDELHSSLKAKAGALLAKSALKRAKDKVDPHEYGGALLLGINGVCVIGHGSSNAHAVVNAIRVAKEAVDGDVLGKMSALLQQEDEPPHPANDDTSASMPAEVGNPSP